jgi:hypothetical protein
MLEDALLSVNKASGVVSFCSFLLVVVLWFVQYTTDRRRLKLWESKHALLYLEKRLECFHIFRTFNAEVMRIGYPNYTGFKPPFHNDMLVKGYNLIFSKEFCKKIEKYAEDVHKLRALHLENKRYQEEADAFCALVGLVKEIEQAFVLEHNKE